MGIAGEWGALTNPTCFTQAVAAQSGSAVPVACQLGGSQRAAPCQARVGTSPWTQGLGSKNNPPGDTCRYSLPWVLVPVGARGVLASSWLLAFPAHSLPAVARGPVAP